MTEIQPDQFNTETDVTRTIDERFESRVVMAVPEKDNEKLRRLIEIVNADDDLYGLWLASNVTAIQRLGMTDHGPVHVKIVMNMAVRMLRMLVNNDVVPSVTADWKLSSHDAEVVVALGALLHDVGMSIQRADHEDFSLFIAQEKLKEILPQIYDKRVSNVMRSEILHAIIAHRSGGKPLTLEAGVVRISDALDMAKGRSRIPFEAGSDSIHSISAAAIDSISIDSGKERPICITVRMTNSAGIFQLDQLFREKLKGSGIEPYVELKAKLKGEHEERLFKEFKI